MNLIEQVHSQKHVWKTLDLLREIVTSVETSRLEQQNITHGQGHENENVSKISELELLGKGNESSVEELYHHISKLEVCDREDNHKKLMLGLNDVKSCSEILKRSLRRSNAVIAKQDSI